MSMGQVYWGDPFEVVEKLLVVADMGNRLFGQNEPQPPV
jgi:hypothetical protein